VVASHSGTGASLVRVTYLARKDCPVYDMSRRKPSNSQQVEDPACTICLPDSPTPYPPLIFPRPTLFCNLEKKMVGVGGVRISLSLLGTNAAASIRLIWHWCRQPAGYDLQMELVNRPCEIRRLWRRRCKSR